jgi:CO/xanthine dehydrogenase Mo-binding subunit
MGAMAREMLIVAAAKEWNVSKEDCYAEKSIVFNKKNGQQKTFGQLAGNAAKEKAPEFPLLKDKSAFKLIGKSINRLDIPEKVTGKAIFGLDVPPKVIEAEYEVPYLAHACMEPLTCTVLVTGDKAEVWTGNQSTTFVLNGVSDGVGI